MGSKRRPHRRLSLQSLHGRTLPDSRNVVLDVGVLVVDETRIPNLHLFGMLADIVLQLLVLLLCALELLLTLLLLLRELLLQLGDDSVDVLGVPALQVRQFFPRDHQPVLQVRAPGALLRHRHLHLPQHSSEELHICSPQLLQRPAPLGTMMSHLPRDLVERDGQDRDQVLHRVGNALGVGLRIALLLVLRQSLGDPIVQIDSVAAAGGHFRREDLGVPHAVAVIEEAPRPLRQEAGLVHMVGLIDQRRLHRRRQRVALVAQVGDVMRPRRSGRRSLQLGEDGQGGGAHRSSGRI
mmetsp:Transcript_18335/g.52388  ORF Transcript_18335/g.52388 Transcript_18335/m.52388 type:complete len:295 (+) Transcript_18335:879-1763(+)